MSTKTTFKRITLVTVAALGLGVLSVAPSSAAAELDSISVSAASTTQATGETLTATAVVVTATLAGKMGVDTLTVTASMQSAPALATTYIAPVLVFSESTTANVGGATPAFTVTGKDTTTVTQATAKYKLYLNAPTVVGTYVVKLTPTGGTFAAATTVSIVVSAPVVAGVSATHSTIAMNSTNCTNADGEMVYNNCYLNGGGGGYIYAKATDTVTATATLANTNYKIVGNLIASFLLDQKNGASNTMASTVPWTVAITSGPGNIQMGGRLVTAKSVTESLLTTGVDGYQAAGTTKSAYFLSDGTTGKTVITFTAGGVLIGTRTITVYGPATALVATLTSGQKTHVGVGQTSTHTITATDVNAAAATLPSGLTVKSSDTAVATVAISGNNTVTVTGVKAGTATITVTDPATTAAAAAATYTATVKNVKTLTAPTITFDKASYSVGELVTMTVSADMADSATANLFTAALVSSSAVVASGTAHTGATHALVSGKVAYKFYAPAVSGSFTVTGTGGADVDLTTLVTAPVVTATVDITNAAVDAATAAGEAAEAAAQDATDAALDATTAAEAAGALAQEAVDLVTELSAEVTKLIAGVRASITYLTKLVMKLAAKK